MLEGDQRVKMGEEDERLELRLSLTQAPLPLNYSEASRHPKTASPNLLFQLFDWNYDSSSSQRGIDVNQAPATEDCEEEPGVSSPNSTISSLSGKKRKGEEVSDDNDGERDSCSPGSGEDDVPDGGVVGGESRRKKLRLSKEQSMLLEERFKEERTLNAKQKLELAKKLKLTLRQVEVWFQNRRARTKLKQKEVDCEYMKKWCEKLSRENKRLEKEILELRALHLSPLCPHCHPISPTVNPDRSIIPWTPISLGPRSSHPPPKM